jgi:hypothetical protein
MAYSMLCCCRQQLKELRHARWRTGKSTVHRVELDTKKVDDLHASNGFGMGYREPKAIELVNRNVRHRTALNCCGTDNEDVVAVPDMLHTELL